MRFSIGEGEVICIDWDERSMRLVEASAARGGLKIRSAVQVSLDSPETTRDPAALGAFIKRALGEHRMRARRAVLAVPRQDIVLNLMSLPRGTQDELAAMIHIQIAKELPFAKDQTVIDFAVSPSQGDSTNMDVWVGAARNQIVDFYRQVIAEAGLRAEQISLRPYANLAALNMFAESSGRTLLVDVGPALTEIDVVRDGRLAYSRAATVAVHAEDGGSAAGVVDSLLVDVNRTIGAYRSTDPEAKIDRIVLAGSVNIDESVVAAFRTRFNVPTQVFSVPAAMKWRDAPENTASFLSVFGLALGKTIDNVESFNLLAPKEPEGERRERIRRVPYKAAIVATLVAVSAAAAYVPVYKQHREIAKLDEKLTQLNQDKPSRDELKTFETNIKDWKGQSYMWLDHLRRLAEVFPRTEKTYINKVDFKDNGELQLELAAVDEFQAAELARAINDLKLGSARVSVHTPSADPKYKITDHVAIQFKQSLVNTPPATAPAPVSKAVSPSKKVSSSPAPATLPGARMLPAEKMPPMGRERRKK